MAAPADDMDEKYRPLKKLGQGAFGEVWKVREKSTRRLYAMKVISIKKNGGNVWQELESSLKIPFHPNLIRYYDHECIYSRKQRIKEVRLYMEFCCEGTLEDYMFKKDTSFKLKLIFMKNIASAVAFLHQHDVIHRDLKPENILMSRNNRQGRVTAKIGDFGTAKITADSGYEGSLYNYYMDTSRAGTLFFMPPEVFDGRYTERADVFSMGVVFAAILIDEPVVIGGQHFMGASYGCDYHGDPRSIADALRQGEDEYLLCEQVGPYYVRQLVNQMLSHNHHDRPTAAQVKSETNVCFHRHINYLMNRY